MYALRYLYRGTDEDEDDDSGYGMVGSVTFALFGDDPRAPGELSIEAGLLILRQYNDELEM